MYRQEIKTLLVNTAKQDSLDEYDAILNNPLCMVISDDIQKLTIREGDSDGGFSSFDQILKLITYKEKVLL